MKIRLAFVVLVFAVAAHGAPPDMAVSLPSTPTISSAQDCPRDGSDSSMTCVLAAVGATTAENRARDRQDLVRLLDWDAWGRLLLVIDFTRDRLGEKRLHIADVYGDGHDIVLPVDAMTWHAAVAAAQRYRDEAAHPPHRVPSPENGIQRVCVTADGMTEIAETVLRGHGCIGADFFSDRCGRFRRHAGDFRQRPRRGRAHPGPPGVGGDAHRGDVGRSRPAVRRP